MINCENCPEGQGACCGIIIFEKEFIDKFKENIEEGYFEIVGTENLVSYMYDDARCPFFDRKTKLCKIYKFRPKVCREYGFREDLLCPYFKPSGNRRSKASQTKIERQIDKKLNILDKMKK